MLSKEFWSAQLGEFVVPDRVPIAIAATYEQATDRASWDSQGDSIASPRSAIVRSRTSPPKVECSIYRSE